jgi:hypothetical protein
MAALAIIWRNPTQIRHQLRWSQQAQIGGRTVYIVQQLLSAERDVWVNASVLEVVRGREKSALHCEPRGWRFRFGW